jgi:hypothetical protein
LITPCFITNDDMIQEIIFLKLFHKVRSFLLFLHQVSWHELHC